MIKKLSQQDFTYIYSKVPRLCVEVVLEKDGGVVLTKRAIEPEIGKWHIPGGTVLLGETLEQAIVRIANEELGVKVQVKGLLGTIEYINIKRAVDHVHMVGLACFCQIESGTLKGDKQSDEIKVFHKVPENIIKEQKPLLEGFLRDLITECDDPECEDQHCSDE